MGTFFFSSFLGGLNHRKFVKNGVRESLPRLRLSGEGGRGRDIARTWKNGERACVGRGFI